jgi:hypothetical protein
MQQSSDLFRVLRYERDIASAGAQLAAIAEVELQALERMEAGWSSVQQITERAVASRAA